MKKFASKLSLESTKFEDLPELVATAIQFAYDVIGVGNVITDVTATTEAGNHAVKVAEAFCK